MSLNLNLDPNYFLLHHTIPQHPWLRKDRDYMIVHDLPSQTPSLRVNPSTQTQANPPSVF